MELLLVHVCTGDAAVPFSTFFEPQQTPGFLVSAGIYNASLAIPLYDGEHRKQSVALILRSLLSPPKQRRPPVAWHQIEKEVGGNRNSVSDGVAGGAQVTFACVPPSRLHHILTLPLGLQESRWNLLREHCAAFHTPSERRLHHRSSVAKFERWARWTVDFEGAPSEAMHKAGQQPWKAPSGRILRPQPATMQLPCATRLPEPSQRCSVAKLDREAAWTAGGHTSRMDRAVYERRSSREEAVCSNKHQPSRSRPERVRGQHGAKVTHVCSAWAHVPPSHLSAY